MRPANPGVQAWTRRLNRNRHRHRGCGSVAYRWASLQDRVLGVLLGLGLGLDEAGVGQKLVSRRHALADFAGEGLGAHLLDWISPKVALASVSASDSEVAVFGSSAMRKPIFAMAASCCFSGSAPQRVEPIASGGVVQRDRR